MEGSGLAYWGAGLTEDQLIDKLWEPYPTISCDVETISIKDRTLIGIGIGLNQQESVYFRVLPEPCPYLQLAWRLLEQAGAVIFHNGIFDLTVLLEYFNSLPEGVGWGGATDGGGAIQPATPGKHAVPLLLQQVAARSQDTSLMAQVQGLPVLSLQATNHSYTGLELDAISDILPARKTMLDLDWATTAQKCLRDCLGTYRLYYQIAGPDWGRGQNLTWTHEHNYDGLGFDPTEETSHWVSTAMQECYEVDRQMIPLLLRMTARGIALRPARVREWYTDLSQRRLFYEDICTKEGFKPSSPQQVGYVLAARGNFLPFTKSKKQLKTDDEVLSMLTDPMANVILEHRKLTKLIGTYFRKNLGKDRCYTHFRQDLSTSRLSSYDDNLQNIPDPARDIFEADNGIWSWLDYDQLELRIMAAISQDPTMLAVYDSPDGDIHWETQKVLWPGTKQRDENARLRSKTFNFAMQYRANPFTLARHTKLSMSVCKEYRERWLQTYPGVDAYQLESAALGWEHGWVENLFGRRCRLPTLDTATPDHIEKCAINYRIQSTGADLVKRAMLHPQVVGMDQALQVHDELLIDGMGDFPQALSSLGPLHTPFKVKYGSTWTKGAAQHLSASSASIS